MLKTRINHPCTADPRCSHWRRPAPDGRPELGLGAGCTKSEFDAVRVPA